MPLFFLVSILQLETSGGTYHLRAVRRGTKIPMLWNKRPLLRRKLKRAATLFPKHQISNVKPSKLVSRYDNINNNTPVSPEDPLPRHLRSLLLRAIRPEIFHLHNKPARHPADTRANNDAGHKLFTDTFPQLLWRPTKTGSLLWRRRIDHNLAQERNRSRL